MLLGSAIALSQTISSWGGGKSDNNYNSKTYDVCFLGRIEEEKGVLEAAKVIAQTNYKMIIAGKVRSESLANELREVCSSCNNIELHIGYLPDEDYHRYISQSRFCILNYQGEYSRRSSGVVFDFLFKNVPIIGKRCRALNFIKEFNVGLIYDSLAALDLDKVLTEQNYNMYVGNIANYKEKHKEYRNKLAAFLGINK